MREACRTMAVDDHLSAVSQVRINVSGAVLGVMTSHQGIM